MRNKRPYRVPTWVPALFAAAFVLPSFSSPPGAVTAMQTGRGVSVPSADGTALGRRDEAPRNSGDAAPSVLVTYDLRSVLPTFDQNEEHGLNLLAAPGLQNFLAGGEWEREDAKNAALPGDAFLVTDLLTQVLGDELRLEGREVATQRESELVVLAPPDVQAKVQALLEAVGQAIGASADITVDVLEATDPDAIEWPASATLPTAEAERLLTSAMARGGVSHASYGLTVTPGRTATVHETRSRNLIVDYDVEIAQGASTWDPIVDVVEEGHRLLVRGVPTQAGLRFAAAARLVSAGEPTERPLESSVLLTGGDKPGWAYLSGPKTLQQVELTQHAFAFSGYLTSDRAIVCASRFQVAGKRAAALVVMRLVRSQGAAFSNVGLNAGQRSLLAVNTDVLSPPRVGGVFADGEWPETIDLFPQLRASVQSEPSLFLFDWIKLRFNVFRTLGPWAIVVSDPSWDRESPNTMRGLLADWTAVAPVRTLELDVQASGAREGSVARAILPCLSGEEAMAVAGSVRNGLWDYDVEVAQMAAVADPVAFALFSGLEAWVRPGSGEGAGAAADVRGQCLVPFAPLEVVEVEAPNFRYFDEGRFNRLRFDQRFALGENGSASVGANGKGGERPSLRLDLRLR